MYRGKERVQWWHTASLNSMQANCHRQGKGKPFTPKQFHPYENRRRNSDGMPVNRETVGTVVAMFVSKEEQQRAMKLAEKKRQLAVELLAKQRERRQA